MYIESICECLCAPVLVCTVVVFSVLVAVLITGGLLFAIYSSFLIDRL